MPKKMTKTEEMQLKMNRLAEQRERAEKCRYHKMAAEIIGDKEHLYFGDYDGGMRYTFGSDETEV